jgi:hypothetical protein
MAVSAPSASGADDTDAEAELPAPPLGEEEEEEEEEARARARAACAQALTLCRGCVAHAWLLPHAAAAQEPQLVYSRAGGDVPQLLSADAATAVGLCGRLVAVGTRRGAVLLLDTQGKLVRSRASRAHAAVQRARVALARGACRCSARARRARRTVAR